MIPLKRGVEIHPGFFYAHFCRKGEMPTPLANGYVKAKTGTNTTDDVYNKWYDAVYEPQAEAVSETEPGQTDEEPQG